MVQLKKYKKLIMPILLTIVAVLSVVLSSQNDDEVISATPIAAVHFTHSIAKADSIRTSATLADRIPTTYERNKPVDEVGVSKNSEVVLTDDQAAVVIAFNKYLISRGEWAVVTSGKRTAENQLSLIKEKIEEKGATRRFPQLEDASLLDTRIWLKAWQWLRAKHVPINAPKAVPGANVKTSMHLEGRAIDFIASDLSDLRALLAGFARSKYARETSLQITAIVREPGCVHINLG